MRQNRSYLFDMSYMEVFVILNGVGVDVSTFFGVGAGVLKPETGAESESEKSDFAHLWFEHFLCDITIWEGLEIFP